MILSTTPKESEFHLKQRAVLGDLLMQKRKDFEKNYLAYSDKEKVEFIENNNMFHNTFPVIANSYEVIRGISLISFYIGSSCVFSSYHSASIGLPLFILSILLLAVYKTDNYFLKSKIFSRWISGKKSQKIIEKMFMCSVADEETLRSLISVYGQEEMVHILTEKDSLTYQEVFKFMKKIDLLKDKKNKIKNAVKCLVEQE